MKTGTINAKKIVLVIGLLLIGATLLLNGRIQAGLFPDNRVVIPDSLKTGVLAVDALFAVFAIFLLINRKPRARIYVDAFVGLGFTLLLLIGLEIFFYYLNQQDPLETATLELIETGDLQAGPAGGQNAESFFQPDDWLGYKPVPSARVAARRKQAGDLLYEVVYSTDEYSRRVTPAENLGPASNFVLFFGGSFAFGEGVNDNETLPYYVSQLSPGTRSYNYGVGGYGPQQMLAKLQSEQLVAEITGNEGRGVLVYIFIRQHIGRAIGSMWVHNQRGDMMPYYYLEPDGTLTRKGNFVSGRPFLSLLYGIAGKSQTLDHFGVSFPLSVDDQDLKTTAKIFEESRDLFQEQFKSDQFYVLVYPSLGLDEFLRYLQAANINYLDYSALAAARNEDFWLGEGHPTTKAHRLVAEMLVQDLGLQESAEK